MKTLLFSFLMFLNMCEGKSQIRNRLPEEKGKISTTKDVISKEKILEIKSFVNNKNYNSNFAIFIDFKIPSNRYRFFIYDLRNEKILEKGIVAHGSGSVIKNSEKLIFSNTEESYQSSLGKYEISTKYTGDFGKSFRLKGLDKTNSNAIKRAIVLHRYDCVPDLESENLTCLSLGCPMLSLRFFKTVEKYIDASKKPVLMYAYY